MLSLLLASVAMQPADYSVEANWLCRPGREDACAIDLDTTVVSADGSTIIEEFVAAENPAVDCFYVYPTVSNDDAPNSDLIIGDEERNVVAAQFARFAEVCNTYAPMYRQITLTALRARMVGTSGEFSIPDQGMAIGDVVAAFDHFIENDNDGRPFVLIGHSQGAGMLSNLIKQHIDGKPIAERMLSAMLIGSNQIVPEGGDVGGTFETLPACRAADNTGCIISYVTFNGNMTPPKATMFGRANKDGSQVMCTNPAALGDGGPVDLNNYLTTNSTGTGRVGDPWVEGKEITTPFVKLPGLLTGTCVNENGASYLSVDVNADPDDPRTDDVGGEVMMPTGPSAAWGWHLLDVHVAIGDLIDLVESQAAAYDAK